jgi:hypothetical protein
MVATPKSAASPDPIHVRLSGELDLAVEDKVRASSTVGALTPERPASSS